MIPDRMERTEFNRLVRDALSNLFDYAALETHALASVFPQPPDYSGSRADYLRHLLQHAIERLQPPDREWSPGSVEWRPYLILHGRYVECASLQKLQNRLSLSERQLRREHSRAVQAVAALLWDQALTECVEPDTVAVTLEDDEGTGLGEWRKNFRGFQITQKPLDLTAVVRGVAETLQQRVKREGVKLLPALSEELPYVLADRVILRLILLSLLNYVLDVQTDGDITLGTDVNADLVTLWIRFQVAGPLSSVADEEAWEAIQYWAQRLGAAFQVTRTPDVQAGLAQLTLSLHRAEQSIVLAVDDQVPAINMFRRYLSRSNVQVVGVQEPEQVLPLARQLQPQVITLDVMMPTMDGWEILQTLRADPETCHIPVIVCSVWDEPELASSLGAADFLKKPITQKDLLDALARLKLLDMPAEQSQASTSEPP
jgi:CheY-like chemotaxis protein